MGEDGGWGEDGLVLRPLAAGLSVGVIFVAVLSLPLTVADTLDLTSAELTAWIIAVWGVPSVFGLVMTVRYRQPLVLTGNVFVMILVADLGNEYTWAELVGAAMVAGMLVLVLTLLRLTDRLPRLLPAPIVFGLLAGAVLDFVLGMFSGLGREPILVGTTLTVYLLSRRFLEPAIPAILPALLAAVVGAGAAGELNAAAFSLTVPVPALTPPDFALSALLGVSPVLVVLITLQANAPSLVFLERQGYTPPHRALDLVSGIGSVVASLLGPTGISLSLPSTAIAAGRDAGRSEDRHRAVYVASGIAILVALLAGAAAQLRAVVPSALLGTLVGLAVLGVLVTALRGMAQGPLTLGPLFAFAITLSDLSLLGLGSFFWAIAGGIVTSLLLERDGWQESVEN